MRPIVDYVETNMIGRLANKIKDRRTDNTEILLEYVQKAGGGHYLEIGSLFGGSAVAVALLKKQLNMCGLVFCIDPLDGYYRKYAPRDDMIDTQSGIPVTPKTFFENVRKFEVADKVFLMQDYSTNVDLMELSFTVAYIDGDHRGDVPLRDWFMVKDNVTQYVIFDNCADTHPDVMRAAEMASNDPEWECVYDKDITFVVGRV